MNLLQNKLNNIKTDLQSVIEIIDSLYSYKQIPDIDINLLKQKVIKSYDDIIKLKYYNIEKEDINESTKKIETITEETETDDFEVKIIETIEDIPEEAKEYYEKVIEERKKEEKKENIPATNDKTIVEEEKSEKTPTENKNLDIEQSNSPLVGIFNEFKNTNDLAAKLQFTPIDDVKIAISINDRIGYIKDLFAGDNEEFNTCLDNINKAENINIVIKELDNKISWDAENTVHKSFLEIVYRKFI